MMILTKKKQLQTWNKQNLKQITPIKQKLCVRSSSLLYYTIYWV